MVLMISPPKYEYLYGMAWAAGREEEREERREKEREAEEIIILMLNHIYLSSNKNIISWMYKTSLQSI